MNFATFIRFNGSLQSPDQEVNRFQLPIKGIIRRSARFGDHAFFLERKTMRFLPFGKSVQDRPFTDGSSLSFELPLLRRISSLHVVKQKLLWLINLIFLSSCRKLFSLLRQAFTGQLFKSP